MLAGVAVGLEDALADVVFQMVICAFNIETISVFAEQPLGDKIAQFFGILDRIAVKTHRQPLYLESRLHIDHHTLLSQ